MIEWLKVKRDKFLYDHFWRLSFLPYDLQWKYDFPTKRLIGYCMKNFYGPITGKVALVAHAYAFDSTVDKDNLETIHNWYGTRTRERVRQLLAKFVRVYYI